MKPSESETEYIARVEFEKKRKIEQEKHKKLAEEEKQKLEAQNVHFMRCPENAEGINRDQ